MDKALLDAFRDTDYLVCLDDVEIAPAHPAPALWVPPFGAPALRVPPLGVPATLAHPWAAWVRIRIDQPLPESLQTLVGTRSWGFITAWNPRSEQRSPAENLAAQRELLEALCVSPQTLVYPAIGVGASGWSEPSLLAIGPDFSTLDALGQRHEQNAYVRGQGMEIARLRLLHP